MNGTTVNKWSCDGHLWSPDRGLRVLAMHFEVFEIFNSKKDY